MSNFSPKLQFSHILQIDPRIYQIISLSSLLIYGIGWLDFQIPLFQVVILIATALITQYFCTRLFKLPTVELKSAFISSLSLCLLLRTNSLFLMGVTAIITILSKFVFRWNHKHIFNPTNFSLVAMILLTGQVWVSPGQWGSTAFLGFLIACLGGLVINRASRSDVTYAFLIFYTAMVFGRAVWLGDPLTIPLHQLENGALLLFAFFMISDPKTTPNSRIGRILFALLVTLGAGYVQFILYRTNGLLWSLVFFSFWVPVIDWLLPGEYYEWKKKSKAMVEKQ